MWRIDLASCTGSRDGFLRGRLGDKEGEFPANYVETLRRAEVLADYAPDAQDEKSLKVKAGSLKNGLLTRSEWPVEAVIIVFDSCRTR